MLFVRRLRSMWKPTWNLRKLRLTISSPAAFNAAETSDRHARKGEFQGELAMVSGSSKLDWSEELVTRSQQGDRDAFGRLVRRYEERLFNSLLRIVASRGDAEDLVQDAFVQAYLNLAAFRGHCSFYTWLYRIALNLAYSNARRRRVRKALERAREVNEDIPAHATASPSARLERAEESEQIRRALAALSDEHRALLVLRGIEGFDYQTIAEVMHLNPGTVRSRLHRARANFRDNLQRENARTPAADHGSPQQVTPPLAV